MSLIVVSKNTSITQVYIPKEYVIKDSYGSIIESISYNHSQGNYIINYEGYDTEKDTVIDLREYIKSCSIYVLEDKNQNVLEYIYEHLF